MDNQKIKETIIDLLISTNRPGIDQLIVYLEESDFFTAPASTMYHGNYEGGLAEHSLNVYNCLEFGVANLQGAEFVLPTISKESIIIVSILHDLCKINSYVTSTRNVKNDATQKWEKVPVYKREPLLPMGHGAKSVYIALQFINLSVEESLSIFWHMGAYDISDYMTKNEMGQAYKDNLLAFLLNQADMMATYISENENYQ